jgi:hypothetical protein
MATMIHQRALPKGCSPTLLDRPVVSQIIVGEFTSKQHVRLQGILLPEFDRNEQIDEQYAYVFDSDRHYDLILGCDFLHKTGLKLDFTAKMVHWMDHSTSMKDQSYWRPSHLFLLDQMNDEATDDLLESNASEILEARYERVDPVEVASRQTHLTPLQQKQLADLLHRY